MAKPPSILIIAGSDSSGGAGIQADIKTITMLGGYASTAITALTAQNSLGVHNVYEVPPAFIKEQIQVVVDDIGVDVIKIGMLANADIIEMVASTIEPIIKKGCLCVLDPVMVAKGGAPLLADDSVQTLTQRLIPLATMITPNIYEAARLADMPTQTQSQREDAARQIQKLGARNILITGGDVQGEQLFDLLCDENGKIDIFSQERIKTKQTHGTGCTLASAIATGLGFGLNQRDAIMGARDFVLEALRRAPHFGSGHGPLGHAQVGQAQIRR